MVLTLSISAQRQLRMIEAARTQTLNVFLKHPRKSWKILPIKNKLKKNLKELKLASISLDGIVYNNATAPSVLDSLQFLVRHLIAI